MVAVWLMGVGYAVLTRTALAMIVLAILFDCFGVLLLL